MNSDRLNRWLTLTANVGVVAGLVLVAIQIDQNTQITRAQIANDYFLADMELELAMMGDDPANSWSKAVFTPNELNAKDAAILDRYFNYGLVQIQRLHEMNELGLAHEGWEDRINYLGWHLGNEVGRRWWSHSKNGFPEDFRQTVDEILARRDHRDNRDLLDALMPKSRTGQD